MKQPKYEISVWEDIISNDTFTSQISGINKSGSEWSQGNDITKTLNLLKERKVAVIGKNDTTNQLYAYDISFKQNINGTSTLTFSMFTKYLPNGEKELKDNPLALLLKNETKIKLFFQENWYDLIVQQIEADKSNKTIRCTATDLYIEELLKNGYNISYNLDVGNSVGNIYELAEKAVENTDWEIISYSQSNNAEKPVHSDIIRQYVREPVYRVRISTLYAIQQYINEIKYYDKNVSIPLSLSSSDIENTNYIYIPYSQYNNPSYRFHFLLSNEATDRQQGTYKTDEEGYLTDVKYCYIDLTSQVSDKVTLNNVEKTFPLFVINQNNSINTLTSSTLLTVSCDRLVMPQQTQKSKVLGTTVSLYKYTVPSSTVSSMNNFGISKDSNNNIIGNNKIYYGVKELQCNSFDKVQNLLGFSNNWTSNRDIYDGWESNSWTELKVYAPKKEALDPNSSSFNDSDIENSDNYNIFGSGAPWEKVNLMWLRTGVSSQAKVGVYSNSVYNEENVPKGISRGEEYTFRVCYGAYVSGINIAFNENADTDGRKDAFNHRTFFNPLELHLTKQSGAFTQPAINAQTNRITHYSQNDNPLPFNYVVRLSVLDEDGKEVDYLLSSKILDMNGCRGNLNDGEYNTDLANSKQKQYQTVETDGDTNFCWVTQQLYAICKRSYSHQELKRLARERRLKLSIEIVFNKNGITGNPDCTENNKICYVDGVYGYDKNGTISYSESSFKSFVGVLISSIQLFKTYRDNSQQKKIILPDICQNNLTIEPEFWYKYYTSFENMDLDSTTPENIPWFYQNNIPYNPNIMQPVFEPCALMVKNFECSNSNRFNILQKLSENFGCWVKFHILHESDGSISLDENGKAKKYITFHNEIGQNHQLGFSYKRNLSNIKRTLDSKQISTKLIVPPNSNTYSKDGYCAIGRSKLCPTREDYFYNFEYYYLNNMLDKASVFRDLYSNDSGSIGYYTTLSNNNDLIQRYNEKINTINLLLLKLEAQSLKAKQFFLEGFSQAEKMIKLYGGKINALYSHIMNIKLKTYTFSDESEPIILNGGSSIINNKENSTIYDGNNVDKYSIISAAGMISNSAINDIRAYSDSTYNALVPSTYSEILKRYREYCNVINRVQSSDQWRGWNSGVFKMRFRITSEWETLFDKLNNLSGIFSKYFYSTNYSNYTVAGNYLYREVDFDLTKDKTFDVFTQMVEYMNTFIENYTIYTAVENQITSLKNMVLEYSNRTTLLKEQKREVELLFTAKYGSYIREGVWNSEQYVEDDLYYLNAVNVLSTSAKPKLTYNISVIDLSPLDKYKHYVFYVGDKSYIEDEEFFGYKIISGVKTPNREKVVFNEINYNLSDPSKNTYTVQNYKSQFDTFFQQMAAQVQSAQFSKGGYDRAAKAITNSGIDTKLLDSSLDNNIITISNALNNSVKMNDNGLVASNPKNPCQRIEINNNGFNFSVDGGRSWYSVYDILSKNRPTD